MEAGSSFTMAWALRQYHPTARSGRFPAGHPQSGHPSSVSERGARLPALPRQRVVAVSLKGNSRRSRIVGQTLRYFPSSSAAPYATIPVAMFRRILCLVVSSWCLLSVAAAQEWPRFRGPDGAGIVTMPDDPALPDTWSRTQNVVWRTDIPGVGWSSPVVWGRTVFVTAVVSDGAVEAPIGGLYRDGERPPPVDVHHWMAYAVDLDSGDIRWQTELFSGAPDHSKHLKNSFASETPVTDGERL
ncbi:MAG TPA: hypothetical protein EYQ83_19385, partial [Acidobacteria bacterium]|nr:hypothetical protein [Acidobacteriota bacterium]